MFRKSLIALGILFAVATLALPTTARAAGNPSVTGGGKFTGSGGSDIGSIGLDGTFAFAAVQQQDGTAVGNAEFSVDYLGTSSRLHVEIDCVTIGFLGDVTRATLSGIVTQVEGSFFGGANLVGQRAAFGVWDGGQGKNSAEDLMSYPLFGPPDTLSCHVYVDPIDFVVNKGNIQVRP